MEEEPPLPDVFFDVVPQRFSKAFDVCETLGCIQAVFTILVVVFHRHRYVRKKIVVKFVNVDLFFCLKCYQGCQKSLKNQEF